MIRSIDYAVNYSGPAEYVASHAVTALLLLTLAGCLLSAATWHLIQKAGPGLWAGAARLWTRVAGDQALDRMQSARLIGPAFKGTLSTARFLGLYAICSFVVALVAVGAFLELAEAVAVSNALPSFDHALSAALGRHLSEGVLRTLSVLTHLGDPGVEGAVIAAMALTLFLRRRYLLAWACIIATAGGGTLTLMLKQHFARARPLHDHAFATVVGYSFPSGHASGSLLVYGLLGYLVVRHTRAKWHIAVVIVTVATIVLVGGSRVLLQVHFLSDVLAGWTSAAAWLALCIAGLETVRRRDEAARLSAPAPVRGSRQE